MVRQVQYSGISKKGEREVQQRQKPFNDVVFFTICSVKYLKNEERKIPKRCDAADIFPSLSRRRGKGLNPKLAMTWSGFWTGQSLP